ncbi:MAG: excinuclease ABC subunit C [Omnitrophica WOR_2 bacterium GWA2_47_8]|nr:MAG: excinuclease ABC subunit C [Omnitrophica WOR_2 bacterium GWA2_47_8]
MNPVRPLWFYIYVFKSEKTGIFYTGATGNLEERLEQHNKGQVFYTRNKLPIKLIYFEACLNKNDAYRREKYLKTGMGKRYIRNRLKEGLTG